MNLYLYHLYVRHSSVLGKHQGRWNKIKAHLSVVPLWNGWDSVKVRTCWRVGLQEKWDLNPDPFSMVARVGDRISLFRYTGVEKFCPQNKWRIYLPLVLALLWESSGTVDRRVFSSSSSSTTTYSSSTSTYSSSSSFSAYHHHLTLACWYVLNCQHSGWSLFTTWNSSRRRCASVAASCSCSVFSRRMSLDALILGTC